MGIESFEWFAVFGILLEIVGFLFMLVYWREPHTGDVNSWKSRQRWGRNEIQYQERIKDDFPWYYDPVTAERFQKN
ncbi:MAG: hypothetical protein COY74_02840 [Nitrosopumilales archaeon CG_4_10_14_0_8_um_filter_34_8]|nr:MAG: hypothetical protein COY74_02840 [Nitrosopumilales archaeon CG_4_10_14_0_8_um_filter_34_8]